MFWERVLRPEIIWVIVPVIALCVWGVLSLMGNVHRHRERMAMIQQGMHPDESPAKIGQEYEKADR